MTVVEQVKSVCFSANIENREGLHQFTVLIRAGQAGQVARGRKKHSSRLHRRPKDPRQRIAGTSGAKYHGVKPGNFV